MGSCSSMEVPPASMSAKRLLQADQALWQGESGRMAIPGPGTLWLPARMARSVSDTPLNASSARQRVSPFG